MDQEIPPPTHPVRLIQVTSENNNKFYNMTPNGSTFLAEWGRVDVTRDEKTYPISKWNAIYKDKVYRKVKPYKDVTHLFKESTTPTVARVPIANVQVRGIIDRLMAFAKKSVADNYTVSSDAVTAAQVAEAQVLIDQLTPQVMMGANHEALNRLLLDLYMVIPRRMANTRDHLIAGPVTTAAQLQAVRAIIDSEQKTLDVMAGQVQMRETVAPTNTQVSLLTSLGITMEPGSAADEALARRMMGSRANELRAVYAVQHVTSYTRHRAHVDQAANKALEAFWHGSRNENWISILQAGLLIRPSNAVLSGSMFGDGIYFADKYDKSAGYTSLSGARWTGGTANTAFLAIMDVHVGKQLNITRHDSTCYRLNASVLDQKGGYDSVFAHKGADLVNNEYIVYRPAQTTIKLLIEVGR